MPIYKGSKKIKSVYLGTKNTNCLIYVPENIKLELNHGALTLKAGSKVYVPNGKNADNSNKFDVKNLTVNKTIAYNYGSDQFFVFLTPDNKIDVGDESQIFSGSTQPSEINNTFFYDTVNNTINKYISGTGWVSGYSLPIGLISTSSTQITSIDQIFQWCGYIGSTAFVLPGVKGLSPNGFNDDGTYKSIEWTNSGVLVTNNPVYRDGNSLLLRGKLSTLVNGNYRGEYHTAPTVSGSNGTYYNIKENILYVNSGGSTWKVENIILLANMKQSDGKITSITPDEVQPVQTARKINYIFKGSQLIFGEKSLTFNVSDDIQSWVVPNGVKSLTVDCVASRGGNSGGLGGRVQCTLAVTVGQTLYFMVGAIPSSINVASYNASDIRIGGTEYTNRVVVAGGGGSASSSGKAGGAGGGLTGGDGVSGYNNGTSGRGMGGTQTEGGAGGTGGTGSEYHGSNGVLGLGGNGGVGALSAGSGGSGYYGGGGGGANNASITGNFAGSGGGGSSYTDSSLCSNVTHTQGYNSDTGYIKIILNFS